MRTDKYELYVDGGGNVGVPTYFSFKTFKNGKAVPLAQKERIFLGHLAPELLPLDCTIFDQKGEETNNIAEYAALYYGLKRFLDFFGVRPVTIYHDSQLVVRQVKTAVGMPVDVRYGCRQPHLQEWLKAVKTLWHPKITYTHVRRDRIVRVLGH